MWTAVVGLLSPKGWKIAGGIVLVLALAGAVYASINAVRNWQQDIYDSGYAAGAAKVTADYQTATSQALVKQQEQLVADAARANKSVEDYLADIAARRPEVIRVAERTVEYAQTVDGGDSCLSPAGVQLIRDHRAALGFTPASTGGSPGTVRGTLSGPGPADDAGGRVDDSGADGDEPAE